MMGSREMNIRDRVERFQNLRYGDAPVMAMMAETSELVNDIWALTLELGDVLGDAKKMLADGQITTAQRAQIVARIEEVLAKLAKD